MGVSQVPGLEQNYQYGLYGQGSKIPFGGLTVGPKVTPATTVEPSGVIQTYALVSVCDDDTDKLNQYVNDENGNKISMGQDGVGLAHRDAKDYGFMLVA